MHKVILVLLVRKVLPTNWLAKATVYVATGDKKDLILTVDEKRGDGMGWGSGYLSSAATLLSLMRGSSDQANCIPDLMNTDNMIRSLCFLSLRN